jgi:hypothetical protein
MLINKYFKLNTMVNIESDYNWSEPCPPMSQSVLTVSLQPAGYIGISAYIFAMILVSIYTDSGMINFANYFTQNVLSRCVCSYFIENGAEVW